jgi:AcrR family transcriptional regulator
MALYRLSIIRGKIGVAYATGGEKLAQRSEDLRVLRTRKLLQKALIELSSEKGFANVTVSDLAERAMVNRSTFYRHYLDKYDLLGQYLEELYSLLDSQDIQDFHRNRPDQPPDKPPAGLVSLLTHIQMNAAFYRVMLGDKGDPAFCARSFQKFIEKGLHRMLPNETTQADPGKPPVDLTVSYLLHAGVGAMVWWLENDQPVNPEQMATWLQQLSMASISLSDKTRPRAGAGRSPIDRDRHQG